MVGLHIFEGWVRFISEASSVNFPMIDARHLDLSCVDGVAASLGLQLLAPLSVFLPLAFRIAFSQ